MTRKSVSVENVSASWVTHVTRESTSYCWKFLSINDFADRLDNSKMINDNDV